jgi:hypothetical protein
MANILAEFLIGLLPKKKSEIVTSVFAIALVLFLTFYVMALMG